MQHFLPYRLTWTVPTEDNLNFLPPNYKKCRKLHCYSRLSRCVLMCLVPVLKQCQYESSCPAMCCMFLMVLYNFPRKAQCLDIDHGQFLLVNRKQELYTELEKYIHTCRSRSFQSCRRTRKVFPGLVCTLQ